MMFGVSSFCKIYVNIKFDGSLGPGRNPDPKYRMPVLNH